MSEEEPSAKMATPKVLSAAERSYIPHTTVDYQLQW